MWARPHVVFLIIAYAFSWTLWIVGWIVADGSDAGDLRFNQDFVWRVGFVRPEYGFGKTVAGPSRSRVSPTSRPRWAAPPPQLRGAGDR